MLESIESQRAEMTAWRHDLHQHPETAFEEERTSALVAETLESFGLKVHRGLAGTGVVATLRSGGSNRAIALRADMDALHIQEANDFEYRSVHDGKMHACGHDGHTAMLLGAAKFLAAEQPFDGIVHFIFQPAEENEGGGRVMVEQGLFEQFPADAVFGMHNWPGLAAGKFSMREGAMMAACDTFEILVTGKGTHAAMPHFGIDAVTVAAEIVGALQTIVARTVDPIEAAVVSVTQIHGGDTWNVLPEQVSLRGSARSFLPEVQAHLEAGIERIAGGVCAAHGASFEYAYRRGYPPVVNTAAETLATRSAAEDVAGPENVSECAPVMGSEDFAYMLGACPGSYIFIGNGDGEGACMVHNPGYDFNDAILTTGAKYWARLVINQLAAS